jgi:septal ring factor EnvC (AmiA/AmiB activator)
MERDVLGTVGDSDSLKGDFLYFELRQKGKPVNPQYWLEAPKS